jgi:hypothetical protein
MPAIHEDAAALTQGGPPGMVIASAATGAAKFVAREEF